MMNEKISVLVQQREFEILILTTEGAVIVLGNLLFNLNQLYFLDKR
jgi:hypothetical protein